MSSIIVKRFLGVAPKLGKTVLKNEQGQTAQNSRVWSQTLRPFDGLALPTALSKATGDIQTIWRYKGNTDWLCWTQDVNIAKGPISNDALEKIYFTGTDVPRVTTKDLYDDGSPGTSIPPASYILGLPAPVGPPVASLNGAGNITASGATWVYTFVRKWSDNTVDESAPSPVSNALSPAAQQVNVTLPNGAITTGDYGITHKRLYRTNGTQYFFVGEYAIGTSPGADNVATASLGSAITTTRYLPPPDGMKGIIELANGVLAGFKDNVIYLSEPYQPHAYPLVNQYTVNWPIVGLGAVGTTIVAVTTAFPYIGRGIDPAAYSFKRHPARLACVAKRSIASSDMGVIWASTSGLAFSDGIQCKLATEEFLSRKEWNDNFAPTTMHGVIFDGRYYAWFQTGTAGDGTKIGGGIILDRSEAAFLTTLGDYHYASNVVPDTDELWVARRNVSLGNLNYVYKWEGDPANKLAYEWKSKMFLTTGLDNMSFAQVIGEYAGGLSNADIAALNAQIAAVQAANNALPDTSGPINGNASGFEIDGGPMGGDNEVQLAPSSSQPAAIVQFRYWLDGVLMLDKSVDSSEPFAIPGGRVGEKHEFALSSVLVEVEQVCLASSLEEVGTT